jgi:hypothetical protein
VKEEGKSHPPRRQVTERGVGLRLAQHTTPTPNQFKKEKYPPETRSGTVWIQYRCWEICRLWSFRLYLQSQGHLMPLSPLTRTYFHVYSVQRFEIDIDEWGENVQFVIRQRDTHLVTIHDLPLSARCWLHETVDIVEVVDDFVNHHIDGQAKHGLVVFLSPNDEQVPEVCDTLTGSSLSS